MTDTNHQKELKKVKRKAYKILEEEGVLSALAFFLETGFWEDDRLAKFSSVLKNVDPNKDIEAEHKDEHFQHHAYLLGGVQTIQISYFEEYRGSSDNTDKTATLYVFSNDEIVLYDKGGAWKRYSEFAYFPWEFKKSTLSPFSLEVARLNKVWMEAVKEIMSEIQRVKKLETEEFYRSQEERAGKEKSNFDLGDFE